MPTIPPEPGRSGAPEPHRHRDMAESFGADAARYDRTRPHYPAAMVRAVLAGAPGPDVLAVGSGTGIDARQFAAAGARVLGIDPDARMAAFAERLGTPTEVAAFEDWDPRGRTFDAVVAGQAWHWIDPDAGSERAARVLRPGGRLAAFWNAARPPAAVADVLADVQRRFIPGAPSTPASALDGYAAFFAKAADAIDRGGHFTAAEQWRFDWSRVYTRDEWLDQIPTGGIAVRMPPERLAELCEATGAAVDALGGTFTMDYTTVVVTATRPRE